MPKPITKRRTSSTTSRCSKWKPIYLVHAYRYIKAGMTEQDVYDLLDVGHQTWANWKRNHTELAETITLAQQARDGEFSFADYVYARLPAGLRELWDKISEWETAPGGAAQVELLLSDNGKRVRQQLYLYALVDSHFSPSRAMARVGVTKKMVDLWVQQEPEFADLVAELSWHKKNFFEECLVRQVSRGDTAAIIFANKTMNKERGYTTEINVKHSGDVDHHHSLAGVLDLTDLLPYLGEACRAEILLAIRKLEEDRVNRELPRQLTAEEHLSAQIVETAGLDVLEAEIVPAAGDQA